ncbi:HAMP domain-containing sensor histidine kinase [Desulfovibrio sp. UCD-KL4C]|uniref:HAMP domain-containing sensor histidine kinase n=1 Tax=Desulfovibrio sp. UCD-KL4C TaxID=2578120 RepID=UPI0025BE3153|nr:HAMP domain-containing sensor histidine kinase [Desulfovibrio sp. UCD-KL4C]
MISEVNYSIKSKLFIVVCLVAMICVTLPLGLSYYHLKADLMGDARQSAQQSLELAQRLYRKTGNINASDRISEVSHLIGEEIAFFSADGKTISGASWVNPKWDVLTREEVRGAKSDGIGFHISFDSTKDIYILYSAIHFKDSNHGTEGYFLIKNQLLGIQAKISTIWNTFFWILPVIMLVCYLVIRFVTRQLSSSVESMVRTAEAVGQGNYKRRIRSLPDKEFLRLANSINWMAERIGEHVGTITSQKNKLQAVLNGMWDGVMVMDSDCRIQSVNRALVEIISGIENCIGRSPLEVIPCPQLQDACDSVVAMEGPDALNVNLELSSGRVYEVNIVRSPHTSDPGQGPGAIAVFHDISEIKRLETVRKDFVANVSHELRTPLTSIKGYAETLLSTPAPPVKLRKTFLRTIEKNADHMCKIVDDLLNLSRIESNSTQDGFVDMDPAEAVSQAWQACSSLAEKRHVNMVSTIEAGAFRVFANSDQMIQLFRNLFENGIKYGPENEAVAVSYLIDGNDLKFIVQDKGPGIPAADQSRIFERFYSVEKFRRNEFGSTGLGLAIARHIVRNHGGDIKVQSPPEGYSHGTAFIFSLPYKPARKTM